MRILEIKVKTNSSKDEVNSTGENMFTVNLTVSPEKGKANKRLIIVLADFFAINPLQVKIIRGLSSSTKIKMIE